MNELKDIIITLLVSFVSFFNLENSIVEEKPIETKNVPEIQIPKDTIEKNPDAKKNGASQKIKAIEKILPPVKNTIKIDTVPIQPTNKEVTSIVPEEKPKNVVTNNIPLPEKIITIDQKIKSATANIFCSIPKGNQIQKITGSAVAISNNGVLLTNAHVAEYILLENSAPNTNTLCYIRTGSPAKKAYKAEVIFIPKEWIYANKDNMKYGTLYGTGNNDYALIYLTKKVQESSADDLSFINIDNSNLSKNEDLILSGYPVIGNILNENSLYNISDHIKIQNTWRLNMTSSDAIDTTYTTLAHHGSSGGAGSSLSGQLKAIMVATTIDSLTNRPNIRLISLGYISSDIKSKTGKSIESLIQNAEQESKKFLNEEAGTLAQILISNSK